MRTIFKYPVADCLRGIPLTVPTVGKIVHAGPDPEGRLCVWVEHERGAPLTSEVIIVGTGHHIPDPAVGRFNHGFTFVDGPFVWHVYTKETT